MTPAATPPTPYLEIDQDRLRANIASVMAWAAERGLAVRPHAKTHKSLEIATLQLQAGAVGLTVATIGEAEVFAAGGCTDLFIAYPLWVSEPERRRLRTLTEQATIRVGCDSVAALRQLEGLPVQVAFELDCGQHRSGVTGAEIGELVHTATELGLDVAGVFTFPGHSYGPQVRQSAAEQEAQTLAAGAAAMRAAGVEPRVISGGSTPSLAFTGTGLTETRPGVYVFNDAQQWELGTCTPEQIALTCVSRVVSRAGGRTVLDCGSKVLGADRAGYASGYGRLLDHPDARIVLLSEHHAVAELDADLAVGETVRVVPNHACNAVNLVDEYVVGSDRWSVAARGANG